MLDTKERPVDPAVGLMLQMLAWIDSRPRRYGETMDAWRTSCPRLSVWEDALAEGLVLVAGDGRQGDAVVRLSDAGAAQLQGRARRGAGA